MRLVVFMAKYRYYNFKYYINLWNNYYIILYTYTLLYIYIYIIVHSRFQGIYPTNNYKALIPFY